MGSWGCWGGSPEGEGRGRGGVARERSRRKGPRSARSGAWRPAHAYCCCKVGAGPAFPCGPAHLDLLRGHHVPVLLQGALRHLLHVNQHLRTGGSRQRGGLESLGAAVGPQAQTGRVEGAMRRVCQRARMQASARSAHLVGVVGHDAQRVHVAQLVGLGLDVLLDEEVLALVGQDGVGLARAEAADVGACGLCTARRCEKGCGVGV